VRGGTAPTDPAQEPYKSYVTNGNDPGTFQVDQFADSVRYDTAGPGVSVSLDNVANDGAPGEGDEAGKAPTP
jgi:hypothetical protein